MLKAADRQVNLTTMWEQITAGFLAQGPLGITVVVLSFVVWKLYQELRVKDAELAKLVSAFQEQLQKVQEARVQDANKTVDRIVSVSAALDRNSEAIKDAINALHQR